MITYLISAIPVGYVISYLKGIDIRKEGSGNIGATNITRVLGVKMGILVFILDAGKALFFVTLAKFYYGALYAAIIGMVAVYAQVFSVYLAFKGGKGVATMFGFYLAFKYVIFLLMCLVWVSVYYLVRKPFIASLSGCFVALLISYMLFDWTILLPILISTVVIFIRHIHNIKSGR